MNIVKFLRKKVTNYLTNSVRSREISQTREVLPSPIREVTNKLMMESFSCPYCSSQNFQKRGFRQKKLEKIQLYLCLSCHKTFTPQITKGKHYPLSVMLDAISIYNLGYSLEQTCGIVNERSRTGIGPSTLSAWLSETADLCKFSRMREFAMKKYSPKDMVVSATLAHRQLYRFLFHRAKTELIIKEEFQHRKFSVLKEFLEMVPVECPHQYFQQGLRASEAPLTFSKTQMIVRAKQNYANKLAAFALQSVKERKDRHQALQKFMLANDSVTVATEVPVYITRDDIEHMKTQLGFEIFKAVKTPRGWQAESHDSPEVEGTRMPVANSSTIRGVHSATSEVSLGDLPKLITGHIDLLQIRNGQIHILDFKPHAEKERPIEQLTLYAMALSRLTGLRLFEFKCAWFDEKDYFEFYPLHVLYKTKKASRRRKVNTDEGTYLVNRNSAKIEKVRPII